MASSSNWSGRQPFKLEIGVRSPTKLWKKEEKMFNRFELEAAIMELAQASSDAKVVNEMVLEKGISKDQVSNALLGIEALTDARLNRVMAIFEEGVREEKIL
jgi:hypothetical protein